MIMTFLMQGWLDTSFYKQVRLICEYEINAGLELTHEMGWFTEQPMQPLFRRKRFQNSSFLIFTLIFPLLEIALSCWFCLYSVVLSYGLNSIVFHSRTREIRDTHIFLSDSTSRIERGIAIPQHKTGPPPG